ncbi:DUF4406 domain-containing protein [Eggerthellaceae bacterium 24-137]
MTRLYISGPVTGKPKNNRAAFIRAANVLADREVLAHIPHMFVPESAEWHDAMRISINELTDCRFRYDGLALLPGWEQSEGAKMEKAVAEACGIPCKTVDEWLEETR